MRIIPHKIFGLFVFLILGLLAFHLFIHFKAASVQDDAYMFVRYADNILNSGEPSFNSGHETTYGLTSPLFLALVLPLRVLFAHNPVLTMLFASSLSAILFLSLLLHLLNVTLHREKTLIKNCIILLMLVSILGDAVNFSVHFASGMDTMLALAFLTAYILVTIQYQETPTRFRVFITGLLGGLAFSVRPDLLIFSFALPLVVLFASSPQRENENCSCYSDYNTGGSSSDPLLFKLLELTTSSTLLCQVNEPLRATPPNCLQTFPDQRADQVFLFFPLAIFSNWSCYRR